MQQYIQRCCWLLFSVLILISCEEEIVEPPPGPDFSIEALAVPTRLNTAGGRAHLFSYKVVHPEGVEAITSVTLVISDAGGTAELATLVLYDDGGHNQPGDMDAIARDGVFTNVLFPDSVTFPTGQASVQAAVVDNAQMTYTTESARVDVSPNVPPVLESFDAPDTLYAGSQPVLLSAVARDGDDLSNIPDIKLRLMRDGTVITTVDMLVQDSLATDRGRFAISLDSTFAAGRDSVYTLEAQAIDLANEGSNIISQSIYLQNLSPVISSPAFRDSLSLPPVGFIDTLHIKLSANDSQGLSDLSEVSFTVTLVGGTTSSPIMMFDDGGAGGDNGDISADDGRFSQIVSIQSSNQPGTYVFDFSAMDRVGNTSITISDTLIIEP